MRRTRLVGVCGAVLSLALLAGACGDDDDDDSGSGSSGAPAPTGAPIEIGFSNVENSPAGSFPDIRQGAEAAVKYVNEELGGVNGRPLDLESCTLNGSGESSIECANKFVQGNKVAVSYGLDFGGAGGTPVYAQAGIPVFGGGPTEPAQLASPNNFAFIGAIAGAVPGVSRYVGEELKPKKVAILAADIPASRLAIDTFSKPVLAKSGVTDVNAVYESPVAADYTPALTKANEGNPDAIMIFFGGQSCSKIMQGSQTLGIAPEKLIYLQVCSAADQLEAGGAGAEGILIQSPYLSPQSDDPEVATYRTAMEAAGFEGAIGPNSQGGFHSIMNLYALMKDISGDITKESVKAALQATKDQPSFMAHPYTCDGRQVPTLPGLCSSNERILKYAGGEFTDVLGEWVTGIPQLGP